MTPRSAIALALLRALDKAETRAQRRHRALAPLWCAAVLGAGLPSHFGALRRDAIQRAKPRAPRLTGRGQRRVSPVTRRHLDPQAHTTISPPNLPA